MSIMTFLRSESGGQLLKYLTAGMITVGFYVGGVWLGTRYTDLPVWLVNTGFYLAATVISYIVNYTWAFQSRASHGTAFMKYITVAALGVGLNFVFVAFLTGTLRLYPALAALIFAGLWPFLSFTAQKLFVFK